MAYNFEYLRQNGPHLICVPKSTLSNWMNELNRWCPSLRAFRFHGNKEERQNQADTYLTNEAASDVGTRPSNTLADGTDDHSKSLRKVRERSGAERASLDEDEHTRDESTPANGCRLNGYIRD